MAKPESNFAPSRRRVTYQCDKCGHVFKRTFKAMPKNDPPCPNKACAALSELAAMKQQMANLQKMIEEQRPPGQIGDKVVVKAVDETARIVMEDYNMTNLKDNIREGESVAPKLPGPQQAAADNYFGGKGLQTAGVSSAQANLLGRRAMAGAFRNMAVPPTAIVPKAKPGDSPIRLVGTEQLRRK